MGVIIFNGVPTSRYNINIWTAPNYEIPEKDLEVYHVPGRSGDLIVDYGSWKNVNRTYTVSSGSDNASFPALARDISAWLSSASGYAVLQDSYEPDVYRMAQFKDAIEITNVLDHAALATITFDCKPQRFLLSGASEIAVTSGSTIPNATNYWANPKIIVSGSGAKTITFKSVEDNGTLYVVDISEVTNNFVIDCEMQECYTGTTSKNSKVTLSNGFPKIPPGGIKIEFSGLTVKVVPNTWVL